MDIDRLRCIVAAADAMHFGEAARLMEIAPAKLGRHIRQIEDSMGVVIFERTTRSVTLTPEGRRVVMDARRLIVSADEMAASWRTLGRNRQNTIRIGAIDTAAAGLMVQLVHDMREIWPERQFHLVEEKSVKLLPRLLAGSLDLALLRPGLQAFNKRLTSELLLWETPVVVLPVGHPLARHDAVDVAMLGNAPMIVPDRRSRPHSHDLVFKVFSEAAAIPNVVQNADEQNTILGMVSAGIGGAIVPVWWTRPLPDGVKVLDLKRGTSSGQYLPLHLVWPRDIRDPTRDEVLKFIRDRVADDSAV